jgi:hypothetical protein
MTSAHRVHRLGAVRTPRLRAKGSQPVTTITVSPAVMAEALRLAGGDARRIRIESATSVVVVNQPRGA